MTTPRQILASANLLAETSGGAIDESVDRLNVHGQFDAMLLEQWRAIASEIQVQGYGSIRALDSIGDEVNLVTATLDEVHGNIRIIIEKPNLSSVFFSFSCHGLATLLGSVDHVAQARNIYVAELLHSFSTEICFYAPWSGIHINEGSGSTADAIPSPRRIVKDVAGGIVPISIGGFLLVTAPPANSAPYLTWQQEASKQMLRCLVNEVWRTNGDEVVVLAGPRTRRVSAGLTEKLSAELFSVATDCARWVFASGRDVEVRHTLFTYELAREWSDSETLASAFSAKAPRALDAAKTSFHAHIRETSKDTLKALGDLRKTLSEEVMKVVQQTRELLSTMWRDFAFAATAVAARIALSVAEKPAATSPAVSGLIASTAVFLAFSLCMTLRSNAKFMAIATESRKSWRDKLYGFLPPDDLKRLADDPVQQSESEYRTARSWVIGAYLVMIALIISSAFLPLPGKNALTSPQIQQQANPASVTPTPTKPEKPQTPISGAQSGTAPHSENNKKAGSP